MDVPGNAKTGVEGANRRFATGTPNPTLPKKSGTALAVPLFLLEGSDGFDRSSSADQGEEKRDFSYVI